SGILTAVQCLKGHRYPLLDGPATALLLTYILLAPMGVEAVQGGTILGGTLLIGLVLTGQLKKAVAFATPNVVGVILMLIALSLLPHLTRTLTGTGSVHPNGSGAVFCLSLLLVLFMATLSHRLSGFLKTVSLMIGMGVGTVLFYLLMGFPGWAAVSTADWISFPGLGMPSIPQFHWTAMTAFACSYLAVLVNSLGSLHGIANITDKERLPESISRSMLFTGISGICCGLMGIVGTVSYSMSPGVVLANRVASRYTTALCGGVIILAALVPKLAALFSMVPAPVVASALCVAMSAQVGAAFALVAGSGMTARDYFVVGLPVLLGTLVGFLPEPFMASLPSSLRLFIGNGLIVGIFLVVILEHLLMRKKA
ncbi:MAG: uracil-xanthine permease family protein, partial [Acidobacteriota bacterium]